MPRLVFKVSPTNFELKQSTGPLDQAGESDTSRGDYRSKVPTWLVALAALAVASFVSLFVILAFQVAGEQSTVANLLDNVGLVFAFAAAVYATGRTTTATRTMWILLSCGLLAWLVGELIFDVRTQLLDRSDEESIADVFFVLFYPFALAALWVRDREARNGKFDVRMLDALIVAGAVALIAYDLIYEQSLNSAPTSAGDIARAAYPVFDGLLLWVIVHQAYNPAIAWDLTRWLLAVGTVFLLVADIFWNLLGGLQYAIATCAAMTCIGVAAVVSPVITRPSANAHRLQPQLVPAIVLALSVVAAACVVVVNVYAEVATLIIGAAIVVALVLVRLVATLTQNNRLLVESENRAVSDSLTNLRNRQYFIEHLDVELQRADREGSSVALLMIDVDSFKSINDLAGHRAGDRALVEIADAMRASSRATDITCRIGGDEMAIVAPTTNSHEAVDLAERLRARVHTISIPELAHMGGISVSIGCCVYPDLADSSVELIERADETLYAVKQSGRDRSAMYVPGGPHPPDDAWQLSRAQAALAARDADFRAVFEHAHDAMVITDDESTILMANAECVRIFGAARELLIGRNVLDFVKPEYQPQVEELIAQREATGQSVGKLHLDVPGDENLLLEFSTARFAPGRYLTIARDISESERAAARLVDSEAHFRAVFENALDAMFVFDDAGIIRDANRAAALLVDESLPELIGKSVDSLVQPVLAADVTTLRGQLQTDQEMTGTLTLPDANGNTKTVEYTGVADFVPGRHLGIVRDVTDRVSTVGDSDAP